MSIFVVLEAMSEFSDYKVLKLKFSEKQSHHHQVLFKPHDVRVDEPLKPRDRTLFCANIPPWAPVEAVKRIFQVNGGIEAVYYELQPSVGPPPLPTPEDEIFRPDPETDPYAMESGFKFAYVVFDRPHGVKNTMTKMNLNREYVVSTAEHPVITGVKRWNNEYNKQWWNKKKVGQQIEEYMKDHDERVAEAKKKTEEMEEPDDEGWVTVAKVERKKPAPTQPGAKSMDESKNKKGRRKKKKLELQNFYSHQIKEEKINKIQQLRKKFDQDKQKIAKMKSERKFRPF